MPTTRTCRPPFMRATSSTAFASVVAACGSTLLELHGTHHCLPCHRKRTVCMSDHRCPTSVRRGARARARVMLAAVAGAASAVLAASVAAAAEAAAAASVGAATAASVVIAADGAHRGAAASAAASAGRCTSRHHGAPRRAGRGARRTAPRVTIIIRSSTTTSITILDTSRRRSRVSSATRGRRGHHRPRHPTCRHSRMRITLPGHQRPTRHCHQAGRQGTHHLSRMGPSITLQGTLSRRALRLPPPCRRPEAHLAMIGGVERATESY